MGASHGGGSIGAFRGYGGGYGGSHGGYGLGSHGGYGGYGGYGYGGWGYGHGYGYGYGHGISFGIFGWPYYGYGYSPGYYGYWGAGPYYDPYYGGGYPYYGGGYAAQTYSQQSPVIVVNQQPRQYDYAANDQAPPPQPAPAPYQPAVYKIAFKDHRIVSALAYWITDQDLHYVTLDHAMRVVALSSVDRRFSEQLNRDQGVQFRLPLESQ